MDQVKVRLTDSLCVAKFSYIKPEAEVVLTAGDFGITDELKARAQVEAAELLERTIYTSLELICQRCDAQDFRMIESSLEVDKRLKVYAREFQKRNSKGGLRKNTID